MRCSPLRFFWFLTRLSAWVAVVWLCGPISAFAQTPGLPFMNAGADSVFQQVDFAQIYLETENRRLKDLEKIRAEDKERVDSGLVSALDLEAPNNAIEEFNRASTLLKAQNSKEAIAHLQKAIQHYSKFVSAYVSLGLAYIDQGDNSRARSEFEAAAKLDGKYPGSFVHLGQLALSLNDFATAEPQLEKAAGLCPQDAKILSTLAYAQNGNHQYQEAVETARRVHGVDHKGLANVHYIAASAAMSLRDFDTMERELTFFLSEDPTNAFAPTARKNLAALAHNKIVRAAGASGPQQGTATVASLQVQTFPNSDRLKAQLNGLGNESDGGTCVDCSAPAESNPTAESGNTVAALNTPPSLTGRIAGVYTIHKSVDDVALFFNVSSHGHMINDLESSDIKILDDRKPPVRVLQFSSGSKLPLRLALLIDTSGSVQDRFSFEKRAAAKFVERMLKGSGDLGFIEGFASDVNVTQDFSPDPLELGKGIDKLTSGGGTALFDAVSFACWKLTEYPEEERVARVLVILSDGEDNSSHSSLKQSIDVAEKTGVTVYAISTREDIGDKTDADKVLEALAERSGGEAMFPGDMITLGKSFDKLRDLIRSRYFIAYKPADFQANGSYRMISIVAEKNGKRLQVQARKGYHARVEANSR
ncbi:MAG: VWA domain-containing protein [Candidatus Sulfotelmatobacter sp.]